MNYRAISFFSLLFVATAYMPAFAIEDGVVVTCDQQKKTLKVEHILDPPNGFWKKHRTTGIKFSDLLVIKKDRVVSHKSKAFLCRINDTSIKVTIDPQPFNDDIQGQCGAAVTGAITIAKDDKTILKMEPFDTSPDCFTEGSKIIKTITMTASDSVPKINRIRKPDL